MAKNSKTPVMILHELCIKNNHAPPTFDLIHSVAGTHENRFVYMVTAASVTAEGSGSSKQFAKHEAALKALMKLKDYGIYNPVENPVEPFKGQALSTDTESIRGSLNFVAPLQDLCLEHKVPTPEFELIGEMGQPHCKEFTYKCNVASITTVASGSTKRIAKQLAAQEMMGRIKEILPEVDPTVLKTYNDLYGNIVTDKTVKISDFSYTFKKLMMENEKTIEDFEDDLKEATEESLISLLKKLNLSHKTHVMDTDPYTIAIILTTDTPFTVIGTEQTPEAALQDALVQTFQILNCFMRL